MCGHANSPLSPHGRRLFRHEGAGARVDPASLNDNGLAVETATNSLFQDKDCTQILAVWLLVADLLCAHLNDSGSF